MAEPTSTAAPRAAAGPTAAVPRGGKMAPAQQERSWLTAYFVAVLVAGTAVWWATTSVHRADLPAVGPLVSSLLDGRQVRHGAATATVNAII